MNSDHPIWTDFKNISVHFNKVIIFPAGGGGHFLISLIEREAFKCSEKFNEFNAGKVDSYFLDLDQELCKQELSDANLNDWYEKLKSWPIKQSYEYAYGHIVPHYFCKIFNVTIGEMVYVDWDEQTSIFCCLLSSIKNGLNTDFNNKQHQLFTLLETLSRFDSPRNAIARLGPNAMNRFDALTSDIRGDFLSAGNLVSWHFLLHSACADITMSVDEFKRFVEDSYGPDSFEGGGATRWYDANKTKLEWFTQNFKCDIIQYRDIFVKHKIRDINMFKNANIDEVAVYHLKNIELIRKLGRLFTPVGAARVEQLISQLKE